MTELENAKITVEIKRLEKKASELEIRARYDESMFSDAWREYGSELAGPPQSITVNNNMAKDLRKKADFLKSVRDGLVIPEYLSDLEKMVSTLDADLERINKKKVVLYQKMSLVRYLSDVVG